VTCILSTGRPVSRLGFFGPSPASHLYVLSSLETLSVWDLRDAGACISTYDSLRRQPDMLDEDEAQASPLGDGIDYLVGCQYEEDTNRLYLLAGEHVGTLHVLAVEQSAAVAVASLRGGAAGGHASDVRCFHWGKKSLLTGGEDARLCLWGAASDARAAGAPVGAAAGTSRKAERAGEKTQRRAAPY
jgi:WD40 repeat protein